MQEDQTVSFQPMYVDERQPWFLELFVLYVLIVLVVFLVKAIKLTASLRKLRKARKNSIHATVADSMWASSYATAYSFKDISALTFFASLLNATWYTADVFLSVRFEKTTSINYVLARTGNGLVALALGLIVCIALYSASMFFQAALRHGSPRGLPPIRDEVSQSPSCKN